DLALVQRDGLEMLVDLDALVGRYAIEKVIAAGGACRLIINNGIGDHDGSSSATGCRSLPNALREIKS
ncbi:hypothetical protein LTR94_033992, partial [Friedmanniomyces endolithicus]